ncbi:MAG: hypothetical protein V3W28_07755 [Thermoplasmata archaeon]
MGRKSRRHDLSRPKTPGLSDSDLQYGDVQALEAGQRVTAKPKQVQQPAAPGGGPAQARGAPGEVAPADAPNPMEFLRGRLGGTRTPPTKGRKYTRTIDDGGYVELMRRLATATGASGIVAQAYITKMQNVSRVPEHYQVPILDMQDADQNLEDFLNAPRR